MINYPFAVLSDIHFNDWSQFSYIRADKINSRLWETMQAVRFACGELKKTGGRDVVITGDLFHTRGKMKPTVFNPVFDLFRELADEGFIFHMLCGNHDLESKDSEAISNAFHAFGSIANLTVYEGSIEDDGKFIFLPWVEYKDDFVDIINHISFPENKIVFCHIGIDGVLEKVAGKVGKAVLDRGFKYVFSGDYHNHKHLGNGIYSVGALTHHSFSDAYSKAGFLIVYEDDVVHMETKAPKFVIGMHKLNTMGNIIRLDGEMSTEDAARKVKALYDYGAKHVQDLTTRPSLKETSASTKEVTVDLDLATALESYIKRTYGENYAPILAEAERIRNDV